ncbi:hypothetical protein SBOR_4859 [Sclerotinia borealis F-4128]|uniref:Uncharacterized protein n=1 Tax=Sclerotinia borealis (strain F-4128) TaxID=1432307 RepID=W9CD90_SCLBF|nr:hypothetical protein SBOR_4859 [Sclerotinia borealis F-4128]
MPVVFLVEHYTINYGAGKRGWSYQSTRSKIKKTEFEIEFSPSILYPLLIASELASVNGFYNVNWTIFDETTGIGIDFWCAFRPNDQDLNNANDIQMNMRMNDEDNEAIPKGMRQKETDNDKREVEQLNSINKALFPGLVASRPTSTVVAINNTKAAAISNSNKRQGYQQLEEQPKKEKAKNSTISPQDTNASDEPIYNRKLRTER